jgi:amino acid permease
LEDIHGLMYFSKIQSKNYQERKVGERIPSVMKCGMGCSLVTFILICIFAPLLLFSTLNPATELNLVNGGDILITLFNNETGLKVPLYSSNQIYGLNEIVATSNISHQFNYSVTNQIITSANDNGAL